VLALGRGMMGGGGRSVDGFGKRITRGNNDRNDCDGRMMRTGSRAGGKVGRGEASYSLVRSAQT